MITTKTAAPSKTTPAEKDAMALLKSDHAAVSLMFADVERVDPPVKVLSEDVKHHVKEELLAQVA